METDGLYRYVIFNKTEDNPMALEDTLVNLTPHPISVQVKGEIITIKPTGTIARVSTSESPAGELEGVPVVKRVMGQVSGIPAPESGKFYIVSSMVLDATDRDDVLAPDTGNTAGRDKDGKITHVTRFVSKKDVAMKKEAGISLSSTLDNIADSLESKGFIKEARELDIISNTIELMGSSAEVKELFERTKEVNPRYAAIQSAWELNHPTFGIVVNSDGSLDATGNVHVQDSDRTILKNGKFVVQFRHVKGDFFCEFCNISSLEGAPETVGGSFSCEGNPIRSLKYAPKTVGRDFICRECGLTSLEGSPKTVGRNFVCTGNKKKFIEGDVKAICRVGGRIIC